MPKVTAIFSSLPGLAYKLSAYERALQACNSAIMIIFMPYHLPALAYNNIHMVVLSEVSVRTSTNYYHRRTGVQPCVNGDT